MKNWFFNLSEKNKKILLAISILASVLFFALFNISNKDSKNVSTLEYIYSIFFFVSLIFAILFAVWMKQSKDKVSSVDTEEEVQNTKEEQLTSFHKIKIENINQTIKDYDLTFIDVETPNRKNDRICSIAIMNYVNGKLNYKRNIYVNPESNFDNINMSIHGITPLMVENAPKFNEVWKDISKYLLNSIIIGHNVKNDLIIVSKTLEHYGMKLNTVSYIDTYVLAKEWIVSDSYKLTNLVESRQSHDALSDCEDCYKLFNKIVLDNSLNIYNLIETYYIQHDEEPIQSQRRIINSQETKSYRKIQTLVGKILADDKVEKTELEEFIKLVEEESLQETYPINNAYNLAKEQLLDDTINVKDVLSTITGAIKQDAFDGVFEGKVFCLTGDFNHGSRTEMQNYIITKGGIIKDNVTKNVNYLVRGLQGSDAYAYGSYGSKVKKALEMKEKGLDIKIISENDIY